MSFDSLLGNRRIRENLSRSMASGHISHFYLISGPRGSGRHTLARLLAAAILCQGRNKPCLSCNPCRKVMEGLHPDFITVDDPEKKTVSVELIRQARADMYVQPNESDHKIYLLPRAQDMRTEAQNALLKILEEPPKYGVFILLTDNPERLLPTVRSRCTELSLSPLDDNALRSALQKEFPAAAAEDISAAMARSFPLSARPPSRGRRSTLGFIAIPSLTPRFMWMARLGITSRSRSTFTRRVCRQPSSSVTSRPATDRGRSSQL